MKSHRFRPNVHTLEGRIAPTIFTPAPAPPVAVTTTVPTADPPRPGPIQATVQVIFDTISGVVTTGASAGAGSVGR